MTQVNITINGKVKASNDQEIAQSERNSHPKNRGGKFKIENQALIQREHINQGPVVQNFVSLTLSLSPQFANYISTSKANTLLFLLTNVRILHCKGFSHLKKNNSVFVILSFEILTNR